MTSLFMALFRFDLNEAAKCVDMPHTLLASLSHTGTKYKVEIKFGLTYEKSFTCEWQQEMSKLGKNSRLMSGS